MFGDDILTVVGGHLADPAELESILLSYFRSAIQFDENTLVYTTDDTLALELKYARSGKPISLRPGPAFRPADEEELHRIIREQLLTPGPTKIGRAVMFAVLPLTGWFRFRDEFQLIPVPAEAPKPQYVFWDHPFLLETAFPSSDDGGVSMLRRGKREREIELVCSLLLFPIVRGQSRSTDFHWVYEPTDSGDFTSSFRQGGYVWPGANFQTDAYSSVNDLPRIPEVDPQTYYSERGMAAGRTLEIPSNFTASFELFRTLSDQERGRFLRAGYWFQQSIRAWSVSRSIASAALVSAIEAIRPDPQKGTSLRQAFMDFVEQFAPGVPMRDRRQFYELRSAISHGGKLLHADEIAWGISVQHANEDNNMRVLSSIVRAALINWLHSPHPRA